MAGLSRRSFVKGTAAVLGGGLYAGCFSFAKAWAKQMPFENLTENEAGLLGALGDTLLPGAEAAGIAYFIDQQLGVPPQEAMLLLKFLDYTPPYAPFYRDGARALNALSRTEHGKDFAKVPPPKREALVRNIAAKEPPNWKGPPAPRFYFVVRADAMDVVYGTVEGFEKLGVSYRPHIAPRTPWSPFRGKGSKSL